MTARATRSRSAERDASKWAFVPILVVIAYLVIGIYFIEIRQPDFAFVKERTNMTCDVGFDLENYCYNKTSVCYLGLYCPGCFSLLDCRAREWWET